jgi:hypothetical protein
MVTTYECGNEVTNVAGMIYGDDHRVGMTTDGGTETVDGTTGTVTYTVVGK